MAISVRHLFGCVGADQSKDLPVLRRLFGFRRGLVPPDPDTSVKSWVSLRQFADGVGGDHININIIRMGFDVLSAAALADALIQVDYCTYRIRNIYRPQGVGVGRVLHYAVDAADAQGFDMIADDSEAEDIRRAFSVHNDGIDAFIVRDIAGDLLGKSPIKGNCDKDSKDDGLLAGGIDNDDEGMSRTFAHEMGHFLGLRHNHGDSCPTTTAALNNLMAQTRCATSTRTSVLLTNSQGNAMDDHCSIRGGC
jgi:hypothetical protein